MTHRLRHAIRTQSFNRPLEGEVEAEETFIGGKEKNKHAKDRTGGKQGGAGKIAVLGVLERGGELRTGVTPNLGTEAVQKVITENVSAVLHVASPVMARRGEDTLGTAVGGTQRVLDAALRAGVERIIVTSSAAAARVGEAVDGPADEQVWTDVDAPGVGVYARSKTLAERAAWDFARQHPEGPRIATILPAFVQGPLLGNNSSASLDVVEQMLAGKMPAVPRLGFSIVDVRDLADLHVRVLDDPKGMGERWIASADFLWLADVAALLRERFGSAAAKVPTKTMPNWLIRLFALGNADMKPMVPDLGKRRAVTSTKAKTMLNWHPRAARDAVMATAESLLGRKP